MSTSSPSTVAYGDGIGPEIMGASLHVMAETLCTDAYRCRFSGKGGATPKQAVALLGRVLDRGIEIVKTETLRGFDGVAGYTLAQGQ